MSADAAEFEGWDVEAKYRELARRLARARGGRQIRASFAPPSPGNRPGRVTPITLGARQGGGDGRGGGRGEVLTTRPIYGDDYRDDDDVMTLDKAARSLSPEEQTEAKRRFDEWKQRNEF
ncbi:MAG TPA: hypothetical protein VKR61_26130 [Bryobacteraceae bacterium]|nr:hypothetical protein [Bryobacteraceae bacterium]